MEPELVSLVFGFAIQIDIYATTTASQGLTTFRQNIKQAFTVFAHETTEQIVIGGDNRCEILFAECSPSIEMDSRVNLPLIDVGGDFGSGECRLPILDQTGDCFLIPGVRGVPSFFE